MKILFIICPSLGIGEAYTAVMLAEQLKKQGCDIFFVGTEIITSFEQMQGWEYLLLTDDTQINYKEFTENIKNFKPDLMIFTDYHMYIYNKYLKMAFNFDWLSGFNIPCMVIDTIGNCRFLNNNTSIYDNDNFSLILPQWVNGILRPVPPHDPAAIENIERTLYFPVFHEKQDFTYECKTSLKKKFGMDPGRKAVIFPLGHWVKRVAAGVDYNLYSNMLRIISHYFNELDTGIDIFVLGDHSVADITYKNVSVRKDFIDLSFNEADNLINASDLVITINRFSNSLSRAAHYGVPALTFINSKDIEVKEGKILTGLEYEVSSFVSKIMRLVAQQNGIIRKYMIFPESDTEVIEQFCRRNPGFNCISEICELFDENSSVDLLKSILLGRRDEIKQKQRNLMEKGYSLPPVNKQIEEFLA